jgi:hypothetical protein
MKRISFELGEWEREEEKEKTGWKRGERRGLDGE